MRNCPVCLSKLKYDKTGWKCEQCGFSKPKTPKKGLAQKIFGLKEVNQYEGAAV